MLNDNGSFKVIPSSTEESELTVAYKKLIKCEVMLAPKREFVKRRVNKPLVQCDQCKKKFGFHSTTQHSKILGWDGMGGFVAPWIVGKYSLGSPI